MYNIFFFKIITLNLENILWNCSDQYFFASSPDLKDDCHTAQQSMMERSDE